MLLLASPFVVALLCAASPISLAAALSDDDSGVVWMTVRSSSPAQQSIDDLRTAIERALPESRLLAETGTMTAKKCDGITSLESTPIDLIGEPRTVGSSTTIRFRVDATPASSVVRSLDLIRFTELNTIRGISVEYGVENEGSGESGSGESGDYSDDGLPVDDEDRVASGGGSGRMPPHRENLPVEQPVDLKELELTLRRCLSRHVDRFMNEMSRVEQCVALHYLAVHTATSMDRVSDVLKKKHRCSSAMTEVPTAVKTPAASTESDVLEDVTSSPDPDFEEAPGKGSGTLQLVLFIVIGLVSLALVVLAINLVIFGLKRRNLRTAVVAGGSGSDPAANNAYSTKVQVDGKDGATVKLDTSAIDLNPRAGGVKNEWGDEEGEGESPLEETA